MSNKKCHLPQIFKTWTFSESLLCTPHASQVHMDREQDEDGDTQSFLGEVTGQESPTKWTITLQLNGQPTTLLIDTGTEVTVISEQTHNSMGQPTLTPPLQTLKGPSNHPLPVKGYFQGTLRWQRKYPRSICPEPSPAALRPPSNQSLRTDSKSSHNQQVVDKFPGALASSNNRTRSNSALMQYHSLSAWLKGQQSHSYNWWRQSLIAWSAL